MISHARYNDVFFSGICLRSNHVERGCIQKRTIQTQILTWIDGAFHALRGADLEVQRGEIIGFPGTKGAGKTVTISCMFDLIRPNGGTRRILSLDP